MYMFLLEQQDVYQDKVPYKSSVWLWNVCGMFVLYAI